MPESNKSVSEDKNGSEQPTSLVKGVREMARKDDAPSHTTLGENVKPKEYSIVFEPDFSTFKFKGDETIKADIRSPTTTIMLNAKELDIGKVVVKTADGEQQAEVKIDAKEQTAELTLKTAVSGPVEIKVEFTGVHNDGMYGFYRSEYTNNGKTGNLLSTQFEAADARAAFPCLDEPELKAKFNVSLIIDKKMEAISNMTVKEERDAGNGKKVVTFEESPKMSTYLLYLGVGEFESIEDSLGGLKIRVVAAPGKLHLAALPMQYAKELVRAYEDYFDIKFQMPKLDLIAVPDFAAGAMENWGAITFRENALLCDDKTALANKQRIAETISHELAHQWFGDLVTMKWWDDLWLNESFATFMGYKMVDKIIPKWEIGLQYVNQVIAPAFSADALKSTHPISVHVSSPGQIDGLFDEISYQKGGSVLYMLEDFVGEDIFRKGLQIYLKKHSYGNASKSDLWSAIQEAAEKEGKNIPVTKLMEDWITKPGYPIIEVSKTKDGFRLRQQRFTLASNESGEWLVGMHYATAGGSTRTLMDKQEIEIKDPSDWIKLNIGQKGLYRVQYSPDILEKLGEMIRDKKMDSMDAWGVEGDLFALARSGRTKMEDYLKFVSAYCMDVGYPVNAGVSSHLNWLHDMTRGTPNEAKARDAVIDFHSGVLKRLGWDERPGERSTDTMLRSTAIASLGIAGDSATVAKAQQMFSDFTAGKGDININIRRAIYSIVAWNGDQRTYDKFVELYRKEARPDEKLRLLAAIGSFKDLGLVSQALEFSASKDVRLQDSYIIPVYAASVPGGKEVVWEWSKTNWQSLMRKYSSGGHMLDAFVENMDGVRDQKLQADVAAFFSNPANMRDDIEKTIAHTKERIEANIKFMHTNAV